MRQKECTVDDTEKLLPTWTQRLKRHIELFHRRTGMKHTIIGMRGIGNSRLWERLQAGGSITVAKADELYAWMAGQGHYFNH